MARRIKYVEPASYFPKESRKNFKTSTTKAGTKKPAKKKGK